MPAKKPAIRTICVSGDQTVRTIVETHAALIAAFADSNNIVLDASDVEDADLTFVQLIESARLTAESSKKKFSVTTPIPNALRDQLERGAFVGGSNKFWKTP